MGRFAFSLQAALDKAEREQRQAEDDVAGARRAARAAAERIREFDEPLRASAQQIRLACEEYERAPATSLSEAQRRVQRLRQEHDRLLAERRLAELNARFERHKVRLRQTELGWAMSRVQAFTRLRDQAYAAFCGELRAREDRVQEDLAGIRATRRAREGAS